MIKIFRPLGTNYSFEHHIKSAGYSDNDVVNGICFVHDLTSCVDVICCATPLELLQYIKIHKDSFPYLLWCDEPLWLGLQGYDPTYWSTWISYSNKVSIYVITHLNQVLEWSWHSFLTPYYLPNINSISSGIHAKMIYIGEYRSDARYNYSIKNCLSLSTMRSKLALRSWMDDMCDICGKGWSSSTALIPQSRDGDWVKDKLSIITGYQFNLCMENTLAPCYITEKIWQSIACGCLPLYYFGTVKHSQKLTQYMTALSEHCINLTDKSYAEVKELILGMTKAEYRQRLDNARDVLHSVLDIGMNHEAIAERITNDIKLELEISIKPHHERGLDSPLRT